MKKSKLRAWEDDSDEEKVPSKKAIFTQPVVESNSKDFKGILTGQGPTRKVSKLDDIFGDSSDSDDGNHKVVVGERLLSAGKSDHISTADDSIQPYPAGGNDKKYSKCGYDTNAQAKYRHSAIVSSRDDGDHRFLPNIVTKDNRKNTQTNPHGVKAQSCVKITQDSSVAGFENRPNFTSVATQPERPMLLSSLNGYPASEVNTFAARLLLHHQVSGVKWMWSKYCEMEGAVLGYVYFGD